MNGEESRQKILLAATEIAAERGYEGTSIGAVSQRSGLPASSIYWHFKDKDALLAAVIEHSFGLWLAGAGGFSPRSDNESVEQRLAAMMERTLKSLREAADFLRLGLMLALERRAEEPSARKMFLSVRDEALRRTVASYTELFPELDAKATRQLGALSMAMADGLFVAHEINGDRTDISDEANVLATALLAAAEYLASSSRATSGSD
ncbi:TetR/AcrR family transcriptional regulator [Mycobacterium sherrisii]|uniref:TetR/AcrR family transcriptional regulator n=1 Tax=Mycobacterium sherrisii TaxID=243061 RepID=UPI000AAE949A|nr:TetR/AcrR family transcriptional regulator [Mycobacterium sherrisii]